MCLVSWRVFVGQSVKFSLVKISKHSGGLLSCDFAPWKFNMDPENRPETQKRKDRLPTIFQGRSVKFSGAYHLFHHLFEVEKR